MELKVIQDMLRLCLACGARIHKGYINIDIRSGHGDLVWDIAMPLPFDKNSIDEILIESAFEHLFRTQTVDCLKDWHEKLKINRALKIYWLPDIDKVIEEYQKGVLPFDNFYGAVMGAPAGADIIQLHKDMYTKESITKRLTNAGFKDMKIEYKNKFSDTKWLYSMCIEAYK